MKEKLFMLLFGGLILFACKTPDAPLPPLPPAPDNGSVYLNKKDTTLETGKSFMLIPSYSETGLAKNKIYRWVSSNTVVASVDEATGGQGKVTANSVGEATITYFSEDKTLSVACKVKVIPQDHGSVKLNIVNATMVYGQELLLVPTYSANGSAKDKTYNWVLSNTEIVDTAVVPTPQQLKIRAKRIGKTTVNYISTDKTVSAVCEITVEQCSNIVGVVFYQKEADKAAIAAQERGTLNTAESTETLLVYDQTPTSTVKVLKVIYELDSNQKLKATYAVVDNSLGNKASVEQFIEERYTRTSLIKGGINYFDAGASGVASPVYTAGTMVGVFLETSDLGIGKTYPLGLKFIDISYLNQAP